MGDLCDLDIKNLTRQFPMENGGRPCWAITGGGAAKYLLQAEVVRDFHGKCLQTNVAPYDDGRPHKDLDVVVFQPKQSGRIRLEFPHELYWTTSYGPLQRCAYQKNDADLNGFFVEFLTGWHFGFVPPSITSAVRTESNGFRVWTMSPEYLIASFAFHARPPRPQDREAIQRLTQMFKIDWDRVIALTQLSQFAFLSKFQIMEVAFHGKHDMLDEAITTHVTERLPRLAASTKPHLHRALLTLPETADEVEHQSMLRGVTNCLVERRDHHDAFHIACQFVTSFHFLREALSAAQVERAARLSIEQQLVRRIGTTPFVNVLTAAITSTAARIRLAPSEQAETLATDMIRRMSMSRIRSSE